MFLEVDRLMPMWQIEIESLMITNLTIVEQVGQDTDLGMWS